MGRWYGSGRSRVVGREDWGGGALFISDCVGAGGEGIDHQ